jgi:acetolactate synthase-1/2/3 large subunit
MNKIRVADYIIKRLHDKYGVKYISFITGNGALVLNDAVAKNKDITPICVHHEQDAGYFALGYSKFTNKLSVVTPTTGCASTNCITPLLAAYQDHVPILFLSGNVALKQTTRHQERTNSIRLKKLGTQEVDILYIIYSLVKYSKTINNAEHAKYELDKAIDIALTPPFGPVWLDLPSDIGATLIEESDLLNYNNIKNETVTQNFGPDTYIKDYLLDNLKKSEKPLVIAGNGIRVSDTQEQLRQFLEKYQIPAVFSYGGKDLLDYNHPLNIGIIGVKGDRAGNFAVQNTDLILVLGCCLNVPQCGYMGEKFAPKAKKIVVDLDVQNHQKDTIKVDKIIECELGEFFKYVN